jgi:hypothetical protein
VKTNRLLAVAFPAVALGWLFVGGAQAYQGKGRVVGFVREEAGKPVGGAALILRGEGLVADSHSTKSGVYELEWCPAGMYRVEIKADGYLAQARESVKVERDKDTRVDWVLRRAEKTKGTVVSAENGWVRLKVGNEAISFAVPRFPKIAALEASQLTPGDEVTVTWILDGGRKCLKDVEGRGTIVGAVTALGDTWVEVTAPGGKAQRFVPPWVGGSPDRGGGPDREVLKKLGRLRVGMKVELTWEMPEGRRVVDVKAVD